MDKTVFNSAPPVINTDLNQASSHVRQTAATSTPMAGLQFANARGTRPVRDSFNTSSSQLSPPAHSSASPETDADPEARLEISGGGD